MINVLDVTETTAKVTWQPTKLQTSNCKIENYNVTYKVKQVVILKLSNIFHVLFFQLKKHTSCKFAATMEQNYRIVTTTNIFLKDLTPFAEYEVQISALIRNLSSEFAVDTFSTLPSSTLTIHFHLIQINE